MNLSAMQLNPSRLPLPSLSNRAEGLRRRRRVGDLDLANGALDRFRHIAAALHPECPVPDVDTLASVARQLTRQFAGARPAPSIRLRLRCLTALHAMAGEPGWGLDCAKQARIGLIVGYVANRDHLIPVATPVIGRMDDAVLVELAWPSLRLDLDDYLDFRRLRGEEAMLRGLHPHKMAYDREQWLQSRTAELALLAHARRRGRESYLGPAAPTLFRVH